jgi:hypothetical protein
MTVTNQVFTPAQRELLAAVLDQIIPTHGEFPGAGELGLAEFVEDAVGGNLKLRRLFTEGLAQVDITAARLASREFTDLPQEARVSVLKEVEAGHPVFFEALVRQSYNGYYTNPRIFQLIGYHRIPTHEYQHRPFDESLLEIQRQRAPFWRQV